ncbi:putative Ig domain-containing protein [Bosea sp. RAC05]|uniref:putative Ig domain-containing protein n=1 Tax=Bosea sp. RAC05 TaxID=1842539 RepID=UPI00083E4749|nr:putative Ig domain-containing protein [Bosea sp. RAC05]AOG03020.1 putative Ig domain protein [Bosea sp. RAC05]
MNYLKHGRIALAAVMSLTAVIPAGSQESSYYYRQLKSGPTGTATPPSENSSPLAFSLASQMPAEAMTGVSIPQVSWTLSGGKAPYSVTATGAPSGLGATSVFGGIPTQAGDYTVTLTARDSSSPAKTQSISRPITVYAPLNAIPSATPQGTAVVGQLISPVNIVASGGKQPYAFSVDGALPPGVSFNPTTGVLSGAPSAPGTYSFRLRAAEAFQPAAIIASDQYTMVVSAAAITFDVSQAPPSEVFVGAGFSTQLSAGGAPGPYVYSGSDLPPGMSVSGSSFSGTFSTAGTYTYRLKADNGQNDATRQYTTVVYAPFSASLSGVPQSDVVAGTPITSVTLTPIGGKEPYTYGTTGSLPSGVAFSNGVLSGTPTTPGLYSFGLSASQSFGNTPAFTTPTFTMNVAAEPITLTLAPTPPTEVMAGTAFSTTLSATGGPSPYTYSGIDLPNGFSLAGGTLTGTFNTPGTQNYSLKAVNAHTEVTRSFETIVHAPFSASLSAAPQSSALTNQNIAQVSVQTTGGKQPYVFGSTGTIPPGLNYTGGVLSGRPSTPGTYTFVLTASHSFAGAQTIPSAEYTMVVSNPPPLALAAQAPVVEQTRNVAITPVPMNPSGGTAPYSYTLIGTPPPGISVDTNGQMNGAPTTVGSYTFQVRATDSTPGTAQVQDTQQFSMTVREPVNLTSTALQLATVGTPYSFQLTATGGLGPYTYLITGLPATLNGPTSGLITGTPTEAQNYTSLVVRVVDSVGRSQTVNTVSLTVQPPPAAAIPRPTSVTAAGIDAGQGQWVLAAGANGLYDANDASGGRSFAGYESGGFPRALFQYNWSTANKANCVIVGINNYGAQMSFAISFRLNGSPLGTTSSVTIPSGLSTRTLQLVGATGNPDINQLLPQAMGPHTNYLIHTFKAGSWDGSVCQTSS